MGLSNGPIVSPPTHASSQQGLIILVSLHQSVEPVSGSPGQNSEAIHWLAVPFALTLQIPQIDDRSGGQIAVVFRGDLVVSNVKRVPPLKHLFVVIKVAKTADNTQIGQRDPVDIVARDAHVTVHFHNGFQEGIIQLWKEREKTERQELIALRVILAATIKHSFIRASIVDGRKS